jgi:cytosine/adenosine deaminase-related metal-dependent hydrolase
MIVYISASYVYPVNGAPIKNGVLGIDEDGRITAVLSADEAKDAQVENVRYYEGLLVPGFVNTHCHLELSHLRGQVAQHTGLTDFVQAVMKLRGADDSAIVSAMFEADKEMFENGIVAVGDISNQAISLGIKQGSKIYYHTFLEVMGFNQATATASVNRGLEIKQTFEDLPLSIVPHAPYSVSAELFAALRQLAEELNGPVCMHNQETPDENAFFERKEGGFLKLYEFLGLDTGFYEPSGKTSLQTVLPMMSDRQRTLLVHNTMSSNADVVFATAIHPLLYWCLCPNANLYIENRLPDVDMLRSAGVKITLGTDSLASNTGLSIFAEMLCLQENFEIPVEELILWATGNGAEFLGIGDRYGSLEAGKRPGINLLDFEELNGKVVLGREMRRLY